MDAVTINAAAKPVTIQETILTFFMCSSFVRSRVARVDVPPNVPDRLHPLNIPDRRLDAHEGSYAQPPGPGVTTGRAWSGQAIRDGARLRSMI